MGEVKSKNVATTLDVRGRKQVRSILADKTVASWMIAADFCDDQGDHALADSMREAGEFMRAVEKVVDSHAPHSGIRATEFAIGARKFRVSHWGGKVVVCLSVREVFANPDRSHILTSFDMTRSLWSGRKGYALAKLRLVASDCKFDIRLV